MKKISLRDAYTYAILFGTYGNGPLDKVKAGVKALLYKMGLDIALQHPIWFRDPSDCPECMTDAEWSKSEFRFLTRIDGKFVPPDPTAKVHGRNPKEWAAKWLTDDRCSAKIVKLACQCKDCETGKMWFMQ